MIVDNRQNNILNLDFSTAEYQLLSMILRESVLPALLHHPYRKLRQRLPISESEVERIRSFAFHNGLLREDVAGVLYYPKITFATLLRLLQSCFRKKLSGTHNYDVVYDGFTHEFFHASLYHIQRLLQIAQRRDKRVLSNKLARIEFVRLFCRIWLTVFERLPILETSSISLCQIYFLLRDGSSQFELEYFIQQLQSTPYCLQLLSLFGNDLEASEVNFPFEVFVFTQNIGLNKADASIFWSALSDFLSFMAKNDKQIKERYSQLEDDFQRSASLIFSPVKSKELLDSFASEFNLKQVEFSLNDVSPLEEIDVICKEFTQQIENRASEQQFSINALFVFIGQPGRGQKDSARILRQMCSQISAWPYSNGYYEWDVQKRLLASSLSELEILLQRYQKGCIYFYNFPPLQQSLGYEQDLKLFLELIRANLYSRMFVFDFVSLAHVQHYLPELESTHVYVIRFKPYTITHLQHHFRQLSVIAEVEVRAEVYSCLFELYEKAKPFFESDSYADQFVYHLFAESLRNMSVRIKANFTTKGIQPKVEIIVDDLLKAFSVLLHL